MCESSQNIVFDVESFKNLPDFSKSNGMISAIAQDFHTKEVLMFAFMNEEAWQKTLETGYAHYYSRSRDTLWKKGESSGHLQKIQAIRIDCDNDCVLLLIEQEGAACHTNHISCFYRELNSNTLFECSPLIKE